MKHKHCKTKITPVSYKEYFNVGDRILVDVECKHHGHTHHKPAQIIKPQYPVKPSHNPAYCDHDHDCCDHNKPGHNHCEDEFNDSHLQDYYENECHKPNCNDIWTDSHPCYDFDKCDNVPSHACKPHHKPTCPPHIPKPPHIHDHLLDRDGDGFYEGAFVRKYC